LVRGPEIKGKKRGAANTKEASVARERKNLGEGGEGYRRQVKPKRRVELQENGEG